MKKICLILLCLSFAIDVVYGIQCSICQICPGSSVDSIHIEKEKNADGCSFCRVNYFIHFQIRFLISFLDILFNQRR